MRLVLMTCDNEHAFISLQVAFVLPLRIVESLPSHALEQQNNALMICKRLGVRIDIALIHLHNMCSYLLISFQLACADPLAVPQSLRRSPLMIAIPCACFHTSLQFYNYKSNRWSHMTAWKASICKTYADICWFPRVLCTFKTWFILCKHEQFNVLKHLFTWRQHIDAILSSMCLNLTERL